MLGDKRDLDQRILIAKCGDRDPATVRVPRAVHYVGPDRIGARVGRKQCRCRLAVLCFGKRGPQRGREDGTHRRIGFRFPRRGKRRDIRATPGRRCANLRRGVGGQKTGELVRVRRQLRRAEHPLRILGVLVQGGTK